MKEVLITQGVYGHRPEGSPFVRVVSRGETCVVNALEADRLVSIGVAKILCKNATDSTEIVMEESVGDVTEKLTEAEEDFNITSMSFNQLKELATQMGIENIGKLNSKQKLIDAITTTANEVIELVAEDLVE